MRSYSSFSSAILYSYWRLNARIKARNDEARAAALTGQPEYYYLTAGDPLQDGDEFLFSVGVWKPATMVTGEKLARGNEGLFRRRVQSRIGVVPEQRCREITPKLPQDADVRTLCGFAVEMLVNYKRLNERRETAYEAELLRLSDPKPEYRMLDAGEIICKGDEVLDKGTSWEKVRGSVGCPMLSKYCGSFRRPLTR